MTFNTNFNTNHIKNPIRKFVEFNASVIHKTLGRSNHFAISSLNATIIASTVYALLYTGIIKTPKSIPATHLIALASIVGVFFFHVVRNFAGNKTNNQLNTLESDGQNFAQQYNKEVNNADEKGLAVSNPIALTALLVVSISATVIETIRCTGANIGSVISNVSCSCCSSVSQGSGHID